MKKITKKLALRGPESRIFKCDAMPLKRRRNFIAKYTHPKHPMHNIPEFVNDKEFESDVLLTITVRPFDDADRYNKDYKYPVYVWLPLDDGTYFLWGNYKSTDLYDWKILYEFRRVLIEKTEKVLV